MFFFGLLRCLTVRWGCLTLFECSVVCFVLGVSIDTKVFASASWWFTDHTVSAKCLDPFSFGFWPFRFLPCVEYWNFFIPACAADICATCSYGVTHAYVNWKSYQCWSAQQTARSLDCWPKINPSVPYNAFRCQFSHWLLKLQPLGYVHITQWQDGAGVRTCIKCKARSRSKNKEGNGSTDYAGFSFTRGPTLRHPGTITTQLGWHRGSWLSHSMVVQHCW